MPEWKTLWNYTVATAETRPGIWRLKEGGYLVHARVVDPRTGKRLSFTKQLPDASQRDAEMFRLEAIRGLQDRAHGRVAKKTRFGAFAASLLERKIASGDLRSAKTRERWEDSLTHHILPPLGDVYCSELRYTDFDRLRQAWAERIHAPESARIERTKDDGTTVLVKKRISPRTANGWLSIARVVCAAMTVELELPKNPIVGVKDFDLAEHPAYTDEEPNALTIDWAGKFLAEMRAKRPEHYAMTYLGFITGLRPSSLRPLRREEDVDWDAGVLRVRRSNTVGAEVMEKTKTGRRQTIHLPPEATKILREHLALIAAGKIEKMKESAFLFPSRTGGMRAPSVLDKPFQRTSKEIGLPIKLTPRGMRRTFQDLARGAGVHDVVTRSISGHATEKMQDHYSTAQADEQRGALAKVISMVERRKAVASG